jgi:hypothetical protein
LPERDVPGRGRFEQRRQPADDELGREQQAPAVDAVRQTPA